MSMLTERVFSLSMFLFLLSVLCSAAATRSESRYSLLIAKISYMFATGVIGFILVSRLSIRQTLFISDFFEGILLVILVLGIIYTVFELRTSSAIDPLFLSSICWVLGAVGFFKSGQQISTEPVPLFLSGHTFFMFLALSAFSVSFLFSVLFIAQDYFIKGKRIRGLYFRLPPLELTGRLNFFFMTIGTAALYAGVISGFVTFRTLETKAAWLLEPTVFLSFVLLVLYAIVLALKAGPLERSRRTAFVSIISYSLLLATFFVAHTLPKGSLG